MHTELALLMWSHRGAYVLSPHLKTETNAECWNTEVKYLCIERWRLVENRCRTAGNDDAGRCDFLHILRCSFRRIRNDTEYSQSRQLLDDKVVELAPH